MNWCCLLYILAYIPQWTPRAFFFFFPCCKSLWQSSDSCAGENPALWARLCWDAGCGRARQLHAKKHPQSSIFIMKSTSLCCEVLCFYGWKERRLSPWILRNVKLGDPIMNRSTFPMDTEVSRYFNGLVPVFWFLLLKKCTKHSIITLC